jgi:hypothetical protein
MDDNNRVKQTSEQSALIRRQVIREKFLLILDELIKTDKVKYKKVKKNYDRWVRNGCPVIESFPKNHTKIESEVAGT